LGETGVWLDAVVSGSVKHPTTSEFLFPLRWSTDIWFIQQKSE
jgi:hypothetical protein